jgi:hypothetical protein
MRPNPRCESGRADTDGDANTACVDCLVGQYARMQHDAGTESSACEDCAAGRADTDRNAVTECAACGPGSFSPGTTNSFDRGKMSAVEVAMGDPVI